MTSEDVEDIQKRIIEVLNKDIGSDFEKLEKFKELYVKTKAIEVDLKDKLSLISSETPTKVQTVLNDVEEFCTKVQMLGDQFSEISTMAKSHVKKANMFLLDVTERLEQIRQLEQRKHYLNCIRKVEEISDNLQHAIQQSQDFETIEIYNNLVNFSISLQASNCKNLVEFINQTVDFWFDILLEKLKREYRESLKMIQWPLISTNQEVLTAPPTPDVMLKFQQQFECLWKLKIPSSKIENSKNQDHPILSRFPPHVTAIEELIQPLQKRFLYHFSGNRPTNRLDKPEWYLRQILQWIEDHIQFLETHVQPIYVGSNAVTEFSSGLVQLVVEKLIRDGATIMENDAILSHTIGEVLNFENQLRSSLAYPPDQPSALLVLTQPHFFTRWIALEKAFAVEKMDVLLSSEKAWTSVIDQDSSDVGEEVRLTECGEGFLQMLLAMTDRYKILPQPGHRLQFLDLQLELLDEFRVRLLQLARQERSYDTYTKSSLNICPILNTVAAVSSVLKDWTDLPFFLQLHSYKVQTESIERQAAEVTDDKLLPWLRTQTEKEQSNTEEGSAFDGMIELFERMQDDLLSRVVEGVMLEVKAKSQPYRLDKWASLPNPDTFIQPSLSPTAAAMLQAVALGLQWLQDSLSTPLFTKAWQKLAEQVNEFLYEELILQRQFNTGGIAQLNYDVQQNLIPLFSQYYAKPDGHFRDLKDACILLSLPTPVALLLLDTLAQAVQMEESSFKSSRHIFSGKQALKDQGVRKLSIEEALSVLRRRIL